MTQLTSKNIKFDKTVVVDEVFMFKAFEMRVILECLNGN